MATGPLSLQARKHLRFGCFVSSLTVSLAALHWLTDFDVINRDWWAWVYDYIKATRRPPLPYTWFPVGGMLGGVVIATAIEFLLRRRHEYGDARKATETDIRKMGLRKSGGVVLGEFNNKLVASDAPRHTIVVAGTRSGKTQGVVIPTIFNFQGSIVIMDVKGELWETTAGARSQMSDCYRLEWTAKDTARYNPLSSRVLPEDIVEVEQRINNLATVLGPEGTEYFQQAAQQLMAALMLLEVCDARHEGREAQITNVAHWTGDAVEFEGDEDEHPLTVKFKEAHQRAIDRDYPESVVSDMGDFALMPARQRGGVVNTYTTEMRAYRTAAVKHALSGCDFSARSLVEGKRPTTLYIVTRAEDLAATSALTTSLLTNIVFSLVSRTGAEAKAGWPMLLLLEEFSALRKTAAVGEAFDRGAGMALQLMPIVQSFSQIEERYSKAALTTFMNNTDWIVAFSQNDEGTRSILERYVGKTTRRREAKNEQDRGGKSFSESMEGVPLIMAQDWGTIPFGEHRVLVKNNHTRPLFVKTPLAYDRPDFAKRMEQEPPSETVPHTPDGLTSRGIAGLLEAPKHGAS